MISESRAAPASELLPAMRLRQVPRPPGRRTSDSPEAGRWFGWHPWDRRGGGAVLPHSPSPEGERPSRGPRRACCGRRPSVSRANTPRCRFAWRSEREPLAARHPQSSSVRASWRLTPTSLPTRSGNDGRRGFAPPLECEGSRRSRRSLLLFTVAVRASASSAGSAARRRAACGCSVDPAHLGGASSVLGRDAAVVGRFRGAACSVAEAGSDISSAPSRRPCAVPVGPSALPGQGGRSRRSMKARLAKARRRRG